MGSDLDTSSLSVETSAIAYNEGATGTSALASTSIMPPHKLGLLIVTVSGEFLI